MDTSWNSFNIGFVSRCIAFTSCPHKKDYAMQMEVPALGDGDNELELSCVVPSADDLADDDDDGNDPDHYNGIRVNNAVLG